MTSPMIDTDQRFTAWQESARKDIERAFGVLQCRFKAMASPIHLMDCHYIYSQAAVCLMMHNMCVQERVMGNCTDRYDPSVESDPEVVATVLRQQTVETVAVDGDQPAQQGDQPEAQPEAPTVTLVRDFHTQLAMNAIRQQEFASLRDLQEWSRLQTSMVAYHGRPPNQN